VKTKVFDNGLVVKHRKSAVILELGKDNNTDYRFVFYFKTLEEFAEFRDYTKEVATSIWTNLTPRIAESEGADYWEYYDRQLDNNGYINLFKDKICIERPSLECERLYQFNKRRMESFLYDLLHIEGLVQ